MRSPTPAVLVLAATAACAGAPAERPTAAAPSGPPPARGATNGGGAAIPALESAPVAEVPGGTYGPYLGADGDVTVAVWAAMVGDARKWFTAAVGAARAEGHPLEVGAAPKEVGLVVVRPAGGPPRAGGGFVVLFTRPGAGGDVVEALSLGAGGALRGGPVTITEAGDDIVWVEAIPTKRGTTALWAVRHADRADLYAALLGPSGERLGPPGIALRHARAWQAVASEDGTAVGAVTAGPDPGMPGPVEVVFLDETGKVEGKPRLVDRTETAELDLDLARVGASYVLAWSDRRRVEPRVVVAALDGDGKPTRPPSFATRGAGEQALIGIVRSQAASDHAFLAWENVLDRPPGGRRIEIARIGPDGSLGPARGRIGIDADDGTLPELAATAKGVAALTLAQACRRGQSCEGAERLPTYVELGPRMELVASEPLNLEALGGAPVAMSWALTCREDGCMALAADGVSPARVFSVRLGPRSALWRPAGGPVEPEPLPRASAMEAIASADPIADVAATALGDRTLAAWVTFFDPSTPYERRKKPAPDGRYDPLRATLQVAAVAADGAASEPRTISLRARSLGGVDLAAGAPERSESLLVWSAIDRKIPQVFVTLVGADGRKIHQRMLTRAKGEVGDVAVTYVGDDAWIVGWVDERSGDPEVYTTKLNRQLQQLGPEHRLTKTEGAASGVSLLASGDEVLVAWADALGAERAGFADIFVRKVGAGNAAPVGEARRIARTRLHSRSPVLASYGSGAAVAWIEDEPDALAAGDAPGILLATLGADGRATGEPARARLCGKAVLADLTCGETACNVVATSSGGEGVAVEAFRWKPGSPPEPARRVVRLSGPSEQQAVIALPRAGLALYADQKERRGRVRRLAIEWADGG